MREIGAPSGRNSVKFAIVFCVVNLHLLRNLSPIGYLAVYVPVVAYVVAQYVSRRKGDLLADRGNLFRLWVLVGFLGYVVSLFNISPSGATTGLMRFFFATPIFMAFTLYTDDLDDLKKHIRTMVFFFAFASLTLPMQFFTGPVSWFADTSSRAGFERYASLVGSLTAVGVIVGCYLLLAQMLPAASRYILLCLIALPALSSLSKAAILNVALSVTLILYLNRRSLTKVFAIVGVCLLTGFVITQSVPIVTERISVSLSSFGLDESSYGIVNYDRSASGSAWDRITSLPRANIDALRDLNSPLVYAVGGGFGMGNTALVPEADSIAPMAHNQFAECFSVFGAIGSGIQFVILTAISLKLYRRYRSSGASIYLIALSSYGLFLANSVFANGTIYQPSGASILFLSLFVATSDVLEKKSRDQGPPVTAPKTRTGQPAAT